MAIKDHIKHISRYRIENTKAVFFIGNRSISFERKPLLLNKKHELNEKVKQLLEENDDLRIKFRISLDTSAKLETKCEKFEGCLKECQKQLKVLRSHDEQLCTDKQSLVQSLAEQPILLISVYHQPKDLFEIKPLIES